MSDCSRLVRGERQRSYCPTSSGSRLCSGDNEQKKIRQVLDLHGYTKEKAIQTMTIFLDSIRTKNHSKESQVTVEIITGTGSHSSQGPVLRSAVSSTLQKRQMNYQLSHSRGSFIVDALSGVDLYQDTSTRYDSKLQVLDASECLNVPHTDLKQNKSSLVSINISQMIRPSSSLQEMDEDTLIATSRKFAKYEDAILQRKEEMGLKRAILKSLELKRIDELEDIELKRILEQSRSDNELVDKELKEALLKSLECKRMDELEDCAYQIELKRSLENSRIEMESIYDRSQREEEMELKEALLK